MKYISAFPRVLTSRKKSNRLDFDGVAFLFAH